MTQVNVVDTIESLASAVEKLDWLEEHFFGKSEWPAHNFPFGLWFRDRSQPVA